MTSLSEKPSPRFVNAGLGFGLAYALLGAAAAGSLPFAATWPLETAVTLAAFTAMTLHKRNRWGWLWTSVAALVCILEALAYITGMSTSHAGGGLGWAVGALVAIGWYCMLRLERRRTAVPVPVQHVVNHHVFHGLPGGAHLPAPPVPGVVEQIPDMPWVTAPRQLPAIEGRPARPASSHLAGAMAALRNRARF